MIEAQAAGAVVLLYAGHTGHKKIIKMHKSIKCITIWACMIEVQAAGAVVPLYTGHTLIYKSNYI